SESDELLLEDPVSEVGDEEELSGKVLYAASFEELAKNHVQYDTIIWVLISLLLVLAWGVGLIMLLYLPVRRYVLQKDISSRRLYITSDMIVYKNPENSMEFKTLQVKASPRRPLFEAGGVVPGDLLLHKIEEVKRSVKQKLESVIAGSHSQASQDDR
ncbi:hypothetical protein B296_00024537, partial [Ensete ventricosum]